MDEQTIINHLLGPNGGVFAFGVGCGLMLMWLANLKIVAPFVQRAHEAEMKTMEVKIEMLIAKVDQLEEFRKRYMDLLERHSKPTLETP